MKTTCKLLLTVFAVCVCVSRSLVAQTAMGVNYNDKLTHFNITDVTASQTTWIRTFFDITLLLQKDATCATSTVATDADLTEINSIHQNYPQYKIALNLKYNFTAWGGGANGLPPTDTTGTVYTAVQSCTNKVLDYVYPSLSLVVTGNEPFITNQTADWPSVVTFVENITASDIAYNTANASKSITGTAIPLYVGAFNNLEETKFQDPSVQSLLQYASTKTGVTGIDLHLHVASYAGEAPDPDPSGGGLVGAITYAKAYFGNVKPMMASEFSIVNYFKLFLSDPLSTTFMNTYPPINTGGYKDVTGNNTVLGFINYALTHSGQLPANGGVTSAEWYAFLKTGDSINPTWFTDQAANNPTTGRKNFLYEAEHYFSQSNFTVATYSIQQSTPGILYNSSPTVPYGIQPWLLNALFCDSTCTPNSNYNDSQNLDWIGDFWAQQP